MTDFALIRLESKNNKEAYIKNAGSEEYCTILMDLLKGRNPDDNYMVVRKSLAERMLAVKPA